MSSWQTTPHEFLPYRDAEVCARVRAITKEELTKKDAGKLNIRVIDDQDEFYRSFAEDIVSRIETARANNAPFVGIFPVGPVPQFELAAQMINERDLDCSHVHSFNMDEYADKEGNTAPLDWEGSFQQCMMRNFFGRIDSKLRPPEKQIHFPTTEHIKDYSQRIEDLGGADVCYGGIGWCGHIAFWDPHLAAKYPDFEEWKAQGAQFVELHPMTIMQNALHSFHGDWSWVPPAANTIGPKDILGAKHRSFWLDGAFPGGDSWQAFIGRLVAFGPITPWVPGSVLQIKGADYTFRGDVAADVKIHMA